MNRKAMFAVGGVLAIAVASWLAFGFFGVHTLFIDDEVSEENPFLVAAEGTSTDGESTDSEPTATEAEDSATEDSAAEDSATEDDADAMEDGGETEEAMEGTDNTDAEGSTEESATPEIVTEAQGQFIDRGHTGEGTAVVITDGERRFLRFEEDFAVDNGPDLNVYLVANADADSPNGVFDDDFIDLGDLKGNIGSQNYEIDPSVDLSVYDTVVIWCVRFSTSFNAADLA